MFKKDDGEWYIQNVQGMSMTTNLIAQCQRDHKEFCFVVKPAPGSRKLNIVGYQQLHEIEQMLFVSNNHVLMKFRGGKTVTLLSNGCIVHQEKRVQRYLEENSTIIGESQINRSKKIILLEQRYGVELEFSVIVALEFNQLGKAQVLATFDQYKETMQGQLELFLKTQEQLTKNFEAVTTGSKSELGQRLSVSVGSVLEAAGTAIKKSKDKK